MYEQSSGRDGLTMSSDQHAGNGEEHERFMGHDRGHADRANDKNPDLPVKVEDPEQPKGSEHK